MVAELATEFTRGISINVCTSSNTIPVEHRGYRSPPGGTRHVPNDASSDSWGVKENGESTKSILCNSNGTNSNHGCKHSVVCYGCGEPGQIVPTIQREYRITLISPRADSQSNYARSNRGRELIKGAPYYFSRVYLLWSMRV